MSMPCSQARARTAGEAITRLVALPRRAAVDGASAGGAARRSVAGAGACPAGAELGLAEPAEALVDPGAVDKEAVAAPDVAADADRVDGATVEPADAAASGASGGLEPVSTGREDAVSGAAEGADASADGRPAAGRLAEAIVSTAGLPSGGTDPPAVSMWIRSAPTASTVPTSPPSEATVPATGDGISTVALSVITSASTWSSSTTSPGLTCHATSSTSAMPSPRSGMRMMCMLMAQASTARRNAAPTRAGPGK